MEKYEDRPLTVAMSKVVYRKWRRYRFVLADFDTGAGKTYIGINSVGQFDPRALLIVITVKKQVDAHYWENCVVAYNKVKKTDLKAVVFNYDITYIREKDEYGNTQTKAQLPDKLRNLLNTALKEGRTPYLILDECQKIKSPTSVAFRSIRKNIFPKCVRTVGLSATPIGNHADDLIAYMILNGFVKSKSEFIAKYAQKVNPWHQMITYFANDKSTAPKKKKGRHKYHKVLDWDRTFNTPLIKQWYYDFTVSWNTDNVLAPAVRKEIQFDLNDKEESEYFKIAIHPEEYDSNAAYRADLNRYLGQLESRYLTFKKWILENDELPKTPILVFYNYTDTMNFLKPRLEKLGYHVLVINGQMTTAQARKMEQLHQINDDHVIVLTQYKAGGTGLNVPNFRVSVMYEFTYSYIEFKQALGRNRRAYQTDTVYQIRLVSRLHEKHENTLEGLAYQNIIDRSREANGSLKKDIERQTRTLVKQIQSDKQKEDGIINAIQNDSQTNSS